MYINNQNVGVTNALNNKFIYSLGTSMHITILYHGNLIFVFIISN